MLKAELNNRKMRELFRYKRISMMNPSLESKVISEMGREARGKLRRVATSSSPINAHSKEQTLVNTPVSTTIQLTSAPMKTTETVINPGWKIDFLKEIITVTII